MIDPLLDHRLVPVGDGNPLDQRLIQSEHEAARATVRLQSLPRKLWWLSEELCSLTLDLNHRLEQP
jgi:hypothetical protein